MPLPPTIPQIPNFNSQYLPQFQQLLESLRNYNALPGLDAASQSGLAATTAAEQSAANINFRDAFDKALADLYGGGVAQSTIATDAEGRLAVDKANVFSQIAGRDADRALALRQYLGGAGLQALGLQGQTLGTAGGLEQNQYNSEVQALLQRAGLMNQQYGQESSNLLNLFGQQSGNALNLGQLANQQYGTQTGNQLNLYGQQSGNVLNLGQLANQQYGQQSGNLLNLYGQQSQNALGQAGLQQSGALGLYGQQSQNAGNQQQMIYQLLNNLLSGQYNGALQYGTGGAGGGGFMGGDSYAGGGGVGGYPLPAGPGSQTQPQQDPNQLMMILQQLFQSLGINLPGLQQQTPNIYGGL